MTSRKAGRRSLFAGVLAAMVVMLGFGPSMPAHAKESGGGGGKTPTGTFSCKATVVRLDPAGLLAAVAPINLFVANPAEDPCATDTSGLANAKVIVDHGSTLYLNADLLVARTKAGKQGFAHAGVTNLTLRVLGLTINAEVLTAEATAGPCPSTSLQSESTTAKVTVTDSLGHVTVLVVAAVQGHIEVNLTALGLGVLSLHLNETISSPGKVTQRALWLHSDLIGDLVVAEAVADVHGDPCGGGGGGGKPPRTPKGFMTGGGTISSAAGQVSHGTHLQCSAPDGPNNLQVNWPGHRFHLESVTTSGCSGDGALAGKPTANFNTLTGTGTGRCNGVSGYEVEWKLTDNGEPGTGVDRFEFKVLNGDASCSLTAAGYLTGGNHQAHGDA